jgi:pyruvate dehydrogenase E2 component (dihydrolipoamide acetyltransferase)
MAYEFKFPDVGEGIQEGRLIKWLIKPGDTIKEDQPVAEVETDKAVVEIPAPKSGVVKQLLYNEKDIMPVGKTIMIIDIANNPASCKTSTQGQQSTSERSATPITPRIVSTTIATTSRQITTGILATPSVRKYAKDHGIDLATIQGSGKHGQILLNDIQGKQGMMVQPTYSSKPTSTTRPLTSTTSTPAIIQSTTYGSFTQVLATPSTKKLARELGLDITTLVGSGRNGLITQEDVQAAAQKSRTIPPKSNTHSSPVPTLSQIPQSQTGVQAITANHLAAKPAITTEQNVQRIPLSMMRLAIARKMVESKTATVPVTHMDEADVTDIVALREKEKDVLAKKGVKLTYLPFFIKAALIALKEHPYLNAEIDMQRREVILKSYYNIGVATDTPEGLLVPVILDADQKSIVDLAREMQEKAETARQGKITIDEMSHGTFTITSIGSIGGQGFTPVINTPQVAILGIGKIMDKPVVRSGNIVIRKMVTLSVTYDHQLIDGGEAARFLASIIQHIEDPSLLFMEME